jgi:hypothetical protein
VQQYVEAEQRLVADQDNATQKFDEAKNKLIASEKSLKL